MAMMTNRKHDDEAAYQARFAAARATTTKAKQDALRATLTHILQTSPMSDEARERITEVIAGGDGNGS
jgi:hypothetical protein